MSILLICCPLASLIFSCAKDDISGNADSGLAENTFISASRIINPLSSKSSAPDNVDASRVKNAIFDS